MRSLIPHALRHSARLRRRTARYTGNAFDRVFRSGSLVQAGQTPFETLHHNGLVSLRYYPPLAGDRIELDGMTLPVADDTHRVPLVIVPPLAVNMFIYDLFPERSLVRFLRAQGFEVYLIDWGRPTRRHSHYNLHTYVAELLPTYLDHVRNHSGQQDLSLHGWSMGGMFTLFYTALSQDPHIRNLVVLGSPIDSHASGLLGYVSRGFREAAEQVRRYSGFRLHDVRPHWLHTPGWMNTLGFKLTNPVGSVMGYWELVVRLGDREFVRQHASTSAFLDRMVAYPGGIIQDTVVRVWIDNQLAEGKIQIGDDIACLDDVSANLLAFAGEEDTMVTPAAARTVMDHVRSADKRFNIVPGGHMGILAGSRAPRNSWLAIARWLALRSD